MWDGRDDHDDVRLRLKIRVSAVQLRPRPPISSFQQMDLRAETLALCLMDRSQAGRSIKIEKPSGCLLRFEGRTRQRGRSRSASSRLVLMERRRPGRPRPGARKNVEETRGEADQDRRTGRIGSSRVAYRIRFSDAAGEHLASLTARDRATLLDRIGRQLTHQPTVETRKRKRMDPDRRMLIAAWESCGWEICGCTMPSRKAGARGGHRGRGNQGPGADHGRWEGHQTMKTVEITEASLAEYGRKTAKETWVLTRRGKPVAAVVPIRRGLDFETFSLSHNPDFIDLINRSWAGYKAAGGISIEELKRKYGLKRTSRPRRRRTRR